MNYFTFFENTKNMTCKNGVRAQLVAEYSLSSQIEASTHFCTQVNMFLNFENEFYRIFKYQKNIDKKCRTYISMFYVLANENQCFVPCIKREYLMLKIIRETFLYPFYTGHKKYCFTAKFGMRT
jgi:hypothetical protein